MLIAASILLLAAMLLIARIRDRARVAELELQVGGVVTGDAREILDYLVSPVRGARLASDLGLKAVERRDRRRLRNATLLARLELPQIIAGLRILAHFSRTVAAVVDMPPLSPLIWRAWRLRGLAAAGALLHQILVAAGERARLRLWILGESFRLCVRSLRVGAIRVARDPEAWDAVRASLADLTAATVQAEFTYDRLVRSLDTAGALAPSPRLTQASG